MINRPRTGSFGLPRRSAGPAGRQWGAHSAPGEGYVRFFRTVGPPLPPR